MAGRVKARVSWIFHLTQWRLPCFALDGVKPGFTLKCFGLRVKMYSNAHYAYTVNTV